MKKNKINKLTRMLFVLFGILTVFALLFAYEIINIDSSIAFKFLIGYLGLTFFLLLYILFIIILNLRKFEKSDISKRMFKFITLFILFGSLNFIFDYIFRPSEIDLLRELSTSLGVSFVISFIDVIFLKRK